MRFMKKILIRIVIVCVVLLIVAVVAISLSLDGIVKRGVETVGPRLTLVTVKLDGVHLSLLAGSGKIKGLVVGNPEGYKAPQAIIVGTASAALKPMTLLSKKLVITSINMQEPDITFEGGFGGNNLSKLLANLDKTTGGSDTNAAPSPKDASAGKKLQVDDFVISGAKVHVQLTDLGGQSVTVPIPDIHLTSLGQGPEGITPAELTKEVLRAIEKEAVKAAASAASGLTKGATDLTKGLGNTVGGSTTNLTKSLGGFFKKKTTNN
jgi:uncharacterized protein involved in outer membrane biogenesis